MASGGELPHLMLALKCLLARRDQVGTVVFDEVDAGIGGQVAEAVAARSTNWPLTISFFTKTL
ncbi:MAG: hypothetical protein BWK76_22510 [Desulfobulbaceae bacterium A2]|nr:MAG: hypothetical protein BWK76_22510 [Desulfobulbaceae bacterium A2]